MVLTAYFYAGDALGENLVFSNEVLHIPSVGETVVVPSARGQQSVPYIVKAVRHYYHPDSERVEIIVSE